MANTAWSLVLLSLLMATASAEAKMYKCTDANGRVSYQEKPCSKTAGSASEVKIRSTAPLKPAPRSSTNKRVFRYYTTYTNQKVIVDACVGRGTPSGAEIKQAHTRFLEIARENIEAGQRIAERGFYGLPAAEIRSIAQKAQNEKRRELREMSPRQLDRLCDSHAGKLRRLSAQVRNRSSGYEEGDLDPEGND